MNGYPLYNNINIVLGSPVRTNEAMSPGNATALGVGVRTFVCPSDAMSVAAGTNYRACSGPHLIAFDGWGAIGGGGIFAEMQYLRANDITDGLSTTSGFSERSLGSGSTGSFDSRRDIWYSNLYAVRLPTSDDDMAAVCAALTAQDPAVNITTGHHWMIGGYYHTIYNHVSPPNWRFMDCSGESGGAGTVNTGVFSARSAHSNGVNVLFMDGSVRFITNSIGLPVWRGLATRAGGEAITLDSD